MPCALHEFRRSAHADRANGYAISNVANPIDVRDDVIRVDQKFTDKWAILGHYMHDSVTQGNASPVPWLALGELQHGNQHSFESGQQRGNQVDRHHHAQPAR